MTPPAPLPIEVQVDTEAGLVISLDGEVLGLIEDGTVESHTDPETGQLRHSWVAKSLQETVLPLIVTEEDAERVLERIARSDARTLAAESLLKAVQGRLVAEAERRRRSAEWLRRRFGPELEAWARPRLQGRRRTLALAYGAIAFRKQPARLKVLDQAAAVRWAEASRPELVRITKSVSAPQVAAALQEDLKLGFTDELPDWLEVTEPGESVRIETGLGRAPATEAIEGGDAAPADD
jgi:hypothetical protein